MKNYYTSLILVAVIVLVFIVQNLVPGFTDTFVLNSSRVYSDPWTLITSIFLHGSLSHLLGNIFALGLFGLILENHIGSKKFLVIYFAGGLISSYASTFFYDSTLGASGAIFAVMGTLAALKPRFVVWVYGVPMPMVVAAIFWLALDVAGLFYPSSIANAAHIAGLAFGVAVGIMFRKKEPVEEKKTKILSDDEFNKWEDDWM